MVWVGLLLNVWVVAFLWLGGALPPPVAIDAATGLPPTDAYDFAFFRIRMLTMGAVVASMIAYLAAQMCDVLPSTSGSGSPGAATSGFATMDRPSSASSSTPFAVITITHFYAKGLPIDASEALWPQLWFFIGSSYVFKLVVALLDTIPFYAGVRYLSGYLEIDPMAENEAEPASGA